MAFSLPVVLGVAVGSLVVCRKIVERYAERIWAKSQPVERFAFLCSIPWGNGVEG
jgi:light-regulated signal transduction histidine kinase (bacteriophytochrome)